MIDLFDGSKVIFLLEFMYFSSYSLGCIFVSISARARILVVYLFAISIEFGAIIAFSRKLLN